jgi:hypothetical protein
MKMGRTKKNYLLIDTKKGVKGITRDEQVDVFTYEYSTNKRKIQFSLECTKGEEPLDDHVELAYERQSKIVTTFYGEKIIPNKNISKLKK